MRGLLLLTMAVLCLVGSSFAVQRMFLGGTFSGLDGIRSRDFAGWDVEEGKWLEALMDPQATILDLDAVRGGLFVVGDFNSIDNKPSSNLGFWDGSKWCAVRQGVDAVATAVWCDTDTSCWVAGDFANIVNLQDSNQVTRFAHYVFDESANEWEFDVSQRGWSHTSGNTISARVDDVSLVVLPGSTHFFLSTGGNIGSGFTSPRTIWRGSKQDNGFWVYVDTGALNGLNIIDFSIDLSVASPVLYLLTDNDTQSATSTLKTTVSITFPCQSDPCVPPLTTESNYTSFATPASNNTIVVSYHRLFAAPNDVRYLIATYDPDGAATEYNARQRVMSQTGTATPALVGSPFGPDAYQFTDAATPLTLLNDGRLLAQGSFSEANLYYPPSPLTTDASGVTGDVRRLDLVTGFAVWNGSLWQQAFGGGFGDGDHSDVRWVYDNSSSQYYFIGGSIRYTYNTRADRAAWYDDDSSLTVPLFPLFDRHLLGRAGEGEVHAIACDTSACADVFVGGYFAFHGELVIGSIAKVAVTREGPAAPEEVGGGLWHVTQDYYNPDSVFQRDGGRVFALVREGDFLYAGGNFERGGPTTATVCLHNVARIDVVTAGAAWEDLNGGCDGKVNDLAFYNGDLFAAGAFLRCGGAIVNRVAGYSSGSWQSLRGGVDSTAWSLEVFQGRLIVGGDFTVAGGLPVKGVAAWDGSKWRALLPACTDDCVGTVKYYFDALASPDSVHDLRADPSGDFLWGLAFFSTDSIWVLARWEPTDGDLGHWTAKGNQLTPTGNNDGQAVAFLSSDVVVVAGDPGNTPFRYANGHISPYNTQLDNWYAGFRTQSEVFVLAEGVGAAASLASPLASLLAFF